MAALLASLGYSCQLSPEPLDLPTSTVHIGYRTPTPIAKDPQSVTSRSAELYAVAATPTGTTIEQAATAITHERGLPFRGKSDLPIGTRWLRGEDVENWRKASSDHTPYQQQELGRATALLAPALITFVQVGSPDEKPTSSKGSLMPQLQLQWSSAGMRAAVISAATSDRSREVVLIGPTIAKEEPIGLFVPDPRIPAGGQLLLLIPAKAPTEEQVSKLRDSLQNSAANATATRLPPLAWQLASQALGENNRRPALLAITAPHSLHQVTDLILAADEPALIRFSKQLQDLDPQSDQLSWLIERSTWRALIARMERDELTPALQATCIRHLGAVENDPGTLSTALDQANNAESFAAHLIEENLAALADRSLAVRTTAVTWLKDRDVDLHNYDPMSSKHDRRHTLREILASRKESL